MYNLRSKFIQWREWLFGDDTHSIQRQIINMIWDTAVFQSVNEARKYAETDDEGNPKLNNMVHGFINHCFFQTQALAIRRLLDKEKRGGKHSVYSLYRLLYDMKQNIKLLTREKILTALDYPYEYENGLYDFYQGRKSGVAQPSPDKYFNSKSMHKNIDFLVGVTANNRNPNDMIREQIFEWLEQRLGYCQEIYDYVNKFIAHAATPESRAVIGANAIKINLGKLYEGHKVICETAHFIGLTLLNHSFGNFLISCDFDQFEHFEKPWANTETIKKLYEFWSDYDRETRKWNRWDWQEEFTRFLGTKGS